MDARMLRELELDGVVRLYTPLAAATQEPAPEPRRVLAVFVPVVEWLVATTGTEEAPFTAPEAKLLDAMLVAVGAAPMFDPAVGFAEAMRQHQPRLVFVLGEEAAHALLATGEPIEALRGRVHDCQGLPAVITFHPSHLLEAGRAKAQAWEDLLLARRSGARA
jgi:hypothetical protein